MSEANRRIGYVGLGNMGGALARRLQLAHPLRVFDVNQTSVVALVESGAAPCASLQELGASCDIVFLCLPTSEHVRSTIFGSQGLAQNLRPGAVIVDQTSGDPTVTRAIATELAALQIALVDAPVSGGPQGAQAGTIAIMVGAAQSDWERIRPVLESISPNIFHAGAVGSGHVIKLVNNVVHGALRLLTLEGAALAVKNGIAPEMATKILNAGGARNFYSETILGERIMKGNVNVGFSLALMHKDVRLACKLGGDSGVPMLFGSLTNEYYQMCINAMGADADVDTAELFIDRLSGAQVVPPASNV